MRNLSGFTILVIFSMCWHNLHAVWPVRKFVEIEQYIDSIILNAQMFKNLIYTEKMKYEPFAPNGTSSGPMNVAQTSFLNDVEMRLRELETQTRMLTDKLQTCPGEPKPPKPPTNVQVQATTMDNISSIVVTWDAPEPTPENLQYKVYFSAVDETGYQPAGEVVFKICDSSQTSASITDLQPMAQYRVRVGAVAGIATESSSPPETKMTPDIIPSEVLNVRVEAEPRPNSVNLAWDPPLIAGKTESFVIYYRDDSGSPIMMEVIKPPTTYYTVQDLTEGTRYTFEVAARTNNGEGPRSKAIEVMTLPFMPPPPRNLNVTALNKTAVMLTWEPPITRPEDGIIRGFNVNYTDSRYRKFYLYKTPSADDLQAVIVKLEPATTYYFQASSRTRKTFGRGGAVVVATTKKDAPSGPQEVRIDLINHNPPKVAIYWNPPRHTYGGLENYTVHWGVKNGAVRKEYIEPFRLKWESDFLDDETNHEFKIFAVNEIGYGTPAVINFTTPKRNTIVPPDVTVDRVKGPRNSTLLRVKWRKPDQPVTGYKILYRKFEWVYSGRWSLKEIDDPYALSTEIPVKFPDVSHIVVVQGIKDENVPPKIPPKYPFKENTFPNPADIPQGPPFIQPGFNRNRINRPGFPPSQKFDPRQPDFREPPPYEPPQHSGFPHDFRSSASNGVNPGPGTPADIDARFGSGQFNTGPIP